MKKDRTEILRLMVDDVNVEFASLEHLDFIRMEEIDNVLSGYDILEVLQMADRGNFKSRHEFFSFDSNHNLISFTDRMKRIILNEYAEDIIEEYSKLGHDDYFYLDDLGIVTAYGD